MDSPHEGPPSVIDGSWSTVCVIDCIDYSIVSHTLGILIVRRKDNIRACGGSLSASCAHLLNIVGAEKAMFHRKLK